MKNTNKKRNLTVYRPSCPAYPNAADRNYVLEKLLNIVTAVVSGMGIITAMACFMLLS